MKTIDCFVSLVVIMLLFVSVEETHAQACGATIDYIYAPATATQIEPGFFASCPNYTIDWNFYQTELPNGSLPDNVYAMEFSNGHPIEINETGTWNAVEAGLQIGDTVKVHGWTYDIDSIDALVTFAESLCPTLNLLFPAYAPCSDLGAIVDGQNDGVPGVQSLDEVIAITNALYDEPVVSVANTVVVLNLFNYNLNNLNYDGRICFNYTYGFGVIMVDDVLDCTAVGIEDYVEPIAVYPNPNNGNFSYEVEAVKLQDISIFNQAGKHVDFKVENNNIEITEAKTGVYIMQIINKNERFVSKVFVQ